MNLLTVTDFATSRKVLIQKDHILAIVEPQDREGTFIDVDSRRYHVRESIEEITNESN